MEILLLEIPKAIASKVNNGAKTLLHIAVAAESGYGDIVELLEIVSAKRVELVDYIDFD